MLESLYRGVVTPSSIITDFLGTYDLPRKKWKRLCHPKQLNHLRREPYDIIVDEGGRAKINLMAFFRHQDNPLIAVIEADKNNKVDLGPGIHPDIFNGTVLEIKYHKNTFHVCDILLFKGRIPSNRSEIIEEFNEELLPFFSRSHVFSYSDLPNLINCRLLFLPRKGTHKAWSFIPCYN